MYSHLEINSALEKVDEGRLAMGIQGPAPPCLEKKRETIGQGKGRARKYDLTITDFSRSMQQVEIKFS